MVRLGFWIVLGALACMAITFLPAVIGGDASDFEFVADLLFCDGDTAVVSVNLSEAALAKGNLGTVLSGFCADSGGRRLGSIPVSQFADTLTTLIAAGLIGVLLIGLGIFRQAGRSAVTAEAIPAQTVQSVSAASVRQRDAEDAIARNEANYRRAQVSANVPPPKPAAPAVTTPDWMLGMSGSAIPAQPGGSPSQHFEFGEPSASAPPSDLQVQLNMLQLAYESSLIMRSEYDAKRAALLRGAGVESADQG